MSGRVLLRRLRADASVAVLLAVVVLLATALAGAAVRGVDAVSRDAVREAVRTAAPGVRDLVGSVVVPPLPATAQDPAAPYDDLLDQARGGPVRTVAAVADVTGPPTWLLTTAVAEVTEPLPRPGPTRRLAVRVDPRLDALTRLVEGRAPRAGPAGTPVEVVVSRTAARLQEVRVGDRLALTGTAGDDGLVLAVVGLFDPRDPGDDAWVVDPSALRPRYAITDAKGNIWTGIAYASTAALPALAEDLAATPVTLTVRVPVTGEGLTPANAPAVAAAVARAATQPVTADSPGYPSAVFLTSGLDELLLDVRRQQVPVLALAALALVGLGAVAAAVLVLAARLLTERRRTGTDLLRARGTSRAQLAATGLVEGLLLGGPAAAAGAALAAVVPGEAGRLAWAVPVVAGAVPALVLAAAGAGEVRGVRRGRARDLVARHAGRAGVGLLLAVTLLCVVAVRRRGVPGGDTLEVDPLVVLTPALVGACAAVLVVRLVARPLDLAARGAGRRRGAVVFLGLARAARGGGLAPVAAVALVVALATSTLLAATAATVEASAREAALLAVGAGLRVEGSSYTGAQADALAALPGVDAVAELVEEPDVPVSASGTGTRTGSAVLLATQPEAYAQVQAGLGDDVPRLAPAVAARLRADPDAARAEPLPVLAGPGLTARGRPVAAGAELDLTVRQRRVPARVVAVVDRLAGAPLDEPWLLADLDGLRGRTGLDLSARTLLGGVPDPARVPRDAAVVEAVGDALEVTTPARAAAAAGSAPLPEAIRSALAPAAVVAAAFAAAAVVLSLLLDARPRAAVLAHLRALGLSRRQAGGTVVAETVPLTAVALVTGLLAGAVSAALVLPVADLRALSGAVLPAAVVLDPLAVLALVAGFGAAVALSVTTAVVVAGRVRPAAATRTVEGGAA